MPERLPKALFAFPGPQRDRLVAAILAGRKTATAGLFEEYARSGEAIPKTGGASVMVDSLDRPVAILETVEVRVLPLGEVDADFARDEGEGFASLAAWREAHERFFRSEAMQSALGDPPIEITLATLVVCERFRVREVLPPRAGS